MQPKVSVIVPVKDRRNLLLRTLDSIYSQNYRPLQLAVVDNGSSDGTPEAAREWARSHSSEDFEVIVLKEEKPGAAIARNTGLRAADGEFTIFFDSDDTMRPQLIEKAVAKFREKAETDIVCWKVEFHQIDSTIHHSPFNPSRPLEDHLINSLLRTQGYMARTNAFKGKGGWNESLTGWDDWELGVRMLLDNPTVAAIDEYLVDIYCRQESITGTDFSSKTGEWERTLAAVAADIEASNRADKERQLRIVSYRRIILAAHYAKEGSPHPAQNLKREALNDASLSPWHKMLLNFGYHYTRKGGRGAWRLLRHFF